MWGGVLGVGMVDFGLGRAGFALGRDGCEMWFLGVRGGAAWVGGLMGCFFGSG